MLNLRVIVRIMIRVGDLEWNLVLTCLISLIETWEFFLLRWKFTASRRNLDSGLGSGFGLGVELGVKVGVGMPYGRLDPDGGSVLPLFFYVFWPYRNEECFLGMHHRLGLLIGVRVRVRVRVGLMVLMRGLPCLFYWRCKTPPDVSQI